MKKNGILHRISTAVLAGAMLLSLASCGASSSQFRRRESHRHRFGQRH